MKFLLAIIMVLFVSCSNNAVEDEIFDRGREIKVENNSSETIEYNFITIQPNEQKWIPFDNLDLVDTLEVGNSVPGESNLLIIELGNFLIVA